jgi:hypothetical protein
MKAYGGVEVSLCAFLTSALDLVKWSASRPCRFTPCETVPNIHCVEGWVGARAGLVDGGEKNTLLLLPRMEPPFSSGLPARSLLSIQTELSRPHMIWYAFSTELYIYIYILVYVFSIKVEKH